MCSRTTAAIRSCARLTGFINALNEDEQIDLVALMRLGRGDGDDRGMETTCGREARGQDASGRTARYLLGEPMLGDLLAEGLDAFGLAWTDERTTPVAAELLRAVDDDGAELVAFLHRQMRLRGVRQRKLRRRRCGCA